MNFSRPPSAVPPVPAPFVHVSRPVPRRQFLRGIGVSLALPLLDAMTPTFVRAADAAGRAGGKPRRALAICNNIGVLPELFFPQEAGRGYALSPYLEHLRAHRDDFTVFSGVSHPDVDGGHPADVCFLTGAPHPGRSGFRNSISLDQFAAERIGHLTRFPSLSLGVNIKQGVRGLSWTAGGALLPCDERASDVFNRLFVQGTPREVQAQLDRLQRGQSVLDGLAGEAKIFQRRLGAADRERLDQYLTSVRDVELRMAQAREWEQRPKPVTKTPRPEDPPSPVDYMRKVELMYDLARLAFESDSTRLVTLMLDSANSPSIDIDGVPTSDAYHTLSHHGKSAEKLTQLEHIDRQHMKLLAKLFADLKATQEDGAPLLDRTMVLYGSNLGNAATHSNINLPVVFAGGGFRHGQHLAFDRQRNYPLTNLYVSMLQRLGIETEAFASGRGPMRGLDLT
jgi:hypothetical protein